MENILNQKYFIDKDFKYVCITKPRRFEKFSIAVILVTYYFYHGERIFNLWSVLQALDENLIENYCTN
ncbi:hypothetical protein H8356DRAFT_1430792 [Neocallimastix lanati (nom. inval.)]|nr:hypothetical protein H8356DRAFT_1430792 [Neocallimastix sp. JGI-2020a]